MTDKEIAKRLGEVIGKFAMEPADDIGRAKTAEAIRAAGVELVEGEAVQITRDGYTMILLADGRKLRVHHSPTLEMVLEWMGVN